MTLSQPRTAPPLRAFGLDPEACDVVPFGAGHIHATWLATPRTGGPALVVQRFNRDVFTAPAAVMDNIDRVTRHLRARLARQGAADIDRCVLRLMPTAEGGLLHADAQRRIWRALACVPRTRTYQTPRDADQARQAAAAFAGFIRLLEDLPGPPLHETIPGFHDGPARLAQLERAVREDPAGRAAEVRHEIGALVQRRATATLIGDLLARGEMPRRTVHNDTKLNNLLFDVSTERPICVIDLDTVMPGAALFDFGDLARSCLANLEEDDPDVDAMRIDLGLFRALVAGWLEGGGGIWSEAEILNLPAAGRLFAWLMATRFLTDYLRGDVYYRTSRPRQNLDRARNQLRLLELQEDGAETMRDIVADLAGRAG